MEAVAAPFRKPEFAINLKYQLEGRPSLTKKEAKIMNIINSEPSAQRTKKLNKMENIARAVADIDPTTGAIDWSKIPWKEILTAILSAIIKALII